VADLIGPFDTFPWSQTEWYQAAGTWASSGVIGTPATSVSTGSFGVTATGLSLSVAIGRAWVHGSGFSPVSATAKSVTANGNATLQRRDRLVIRRDLAAQTVTLEILQGTPAGTPVAPALTQSETGVWEIPVASFLVPANNATTLSGFVDERQWISPDGGRRPRLFYATAGGTIGTSTGAEVRLTSATFNKQAVLIAGNSYRVHVRGLLNSDTGGVTAKMHVRARADGSTVTTSDTVVGTQQTTMPSQTGSIGRERARIDDEFTTATTGVHSFALFLDTSAGSLDLISDARGVVDFWLEDAGPSSTGLISL
jgi:hypothetical protein